VTSSRLPQIDGGACLQKKEQLSRSLDAQRITPEMNRRSMIRSIRIKELTAPAQEKSRSVARLLFSVWE
jgi:hypothetical protein